MSSELAIVGGGNMGAALLGGLLASRTIGPDKVAVVEVLERRRHELVSLHPDVLVAETTPSCDAAVIAVKPYDAGAATSAAVAAGANRILSIAAGVSIATLQGAADSVRPGVAVIRAMPNTPALVRLGVAAISGGPHATEDDLAWAELVLGSVGTVARVPEAQLDAVTGLAGSGPAYIFLVAEALIDAGVLAGLARPTVEAMVAQLLVGSAELLRQEGDPARLRGNVTSPGGTTAAGLRALEDRGVRAAFLAAVTAATERSRELGQSS